MRITWNWYVACTHPAHARTYYYSGNGLTAFFTMSKIFKTKADAFAEWNYDGAPFFPGWEAQLCQVRSAEDA